MAEPGFTPRPVCLRGLHPQPLLHTVAVSFKLSLLILHEAQDLGKGWWQLGSQHSEDSVLCIHHNVTTAVSAPGSH